MQDPCERPAPILRRDEPPARRPRVLAGAVATAAALCCAASALPILAPGWGDLSALFLVRQDRWLLLAGLGVLIVACLRLRGRDVALDLPSWAPWAMAAGIFALCLAGHRWILDGYDMSRDEQMASFDALVFAAGRLAEPLPPAWQAHADALNTLFMLPVARPVAWVSGYLPMNAGLRALVGLVADPALTGPLLAGLGLVVLWHCARRLWPRDREAAVVAVILYMGSGQILFAGMTAYAMPAHLTLDLLWLWLFLMARRAADLGALLVALVATGLHQPLFHPLFALPFLVGLVRDRAWARAALYGAGYAAISALWLAWPATMRALVAGAASPAREAGTDYASRLAGALMQGDPTRWADMAGNLLRFAAWQPVLLPPLMAAGAVLGWRERPVPALAASVALPVLVMAVILPYQGHGFGYRYLHGVLGPAILLAAEGWRRLVRRDDRLRALVVRTALAGLASVLPLQAVLAHAFSAPFARIDARLRASGADYAIVGPDDAPFAKDLVLNRPDLSNRPLRLLADRVADDLPTELCRTHARVVLTAGALYSEIDAWFGSPPSGAADARFVGLSEKLRAAGCEVGRIGGP